MARLLLAVLLVTVGSIVGCGTAVPDSPVRKGMHDGTTFQLPHEKGFVELVNEPLVTDRRNPQPTSIVAYFFLPDGKSSMSAGSLAEVTFQIQPGATSRQRGRSKATVMSLELKPEPKGDDPAGTGRFASQTGPYDLASIRGTLAAKVDGEAVSVLDMGAR